MSIIPLSLPRVPSRPPESSQQRRCDDEEDRPQRSHGCWPPDHTVTATVSGVGPGWQVAFAVTSGPNTGASFTCSANADCTTDANLEVSGTYTGDGGAGQDTIEACVQIINGLSANALAGNGQPSCDTATKDWVQPTATPTPTATAVATATPTPTQAAPAGQLPATGTQPPADADVPWLPVAIVALGALALGGGVLLRRRAG